MSMGELTRRAAALAGVASLVAAATITFAPSASAATITQTSPTTVDTTTAASLGFTDQITPTNDPNNLGDPVIYTTVVPNASVSASSTGFVTTSGTLAVGEYTTSGTDADTLGLDSGSWTYTLDVQNVAIGQTTPTSGATTTSGSTTFADQLEPTTNAGNAVTFAATGGANESDFTVSSGGAISLASSPLAVGSYTVTGTDRDTLENTGTWTYTLDVGNTAIGQTTPTSGATTTSGSTTFADQLEPTTNAGNAVTFAATGGANESDFTVTSGGAISLTSSPLAVGSYTVTGTDRDTLENTGTWTYTLTVGNGAIAQTAPLTGVTTTSGSITFAAQLEPTTNAGNAVTFAATGGANESDFTVTSGGAISVASPPLAVGSYTVTGTDRDTLDNTGTWTYSLTVNSSGGGAPPPAPGALVQTAPTTGTTTTTTSATFQAGPLAVSGATGTVTFVTTSTSSSLSVSASGEVTTTGTLSVGTYEVAGTDSDAAGDTGTWTYRLSVNLPAVTVTFIANGGTGTMASETDNAPTPLTPNLFTWTKHGFTRWNTAADGTGTSYANGATYGFTAAITLYAQWVVTSHPPAKHHVSFNANGGSGTMAIQTNSVLATLASNGFTRAHYTFNDWNTAANDSGTSYANGGAYSFKKSITLYAQWTLKPKASHRVNFNANGGTGSMAPEAKSAPGRLSANKFKRTGYTFARWNTSANNSGASYVNNSPYNFKKSITLFAQWKAKPVVVIPPVDAVVVVSPFADKSSVLSPAIEAQISGLAATVKRDHDTKIALVGFSGELTTANQLNEADWAASLKLALARARAVETYLQQQLAAQGVTGSAITVSGNTTALPVSSASLPANQKVVASLT